MYSIVVRETGVGDMTVDLGGEFDFSSLDSLRDALDVVTDLRRPAVVDLSGVTFLDLGCARELAVRSQLYAHHLALRGPSWQVNTTIRACGLEDWFDRLPGGEPVCSETA